MEKRKHSGDNWDRASAIRRRTEQVDAEFASTSRASQSTLMLSETISAADLSTNIESLAGKVEKLQMTNFMCHANLELAFNHRINFVTGRNGSGKSAIVAALIVVLGGTASLTGRGSGISDFIKKGENAAKVSITLVNEGVNSYKREKYGSRVVIVRTFTRNSNNSYVCKSGSGQIISKKKEEVDRIRNAFNLQIKNPICILNQDTARSFLGVTDNSMRYNMFMKATQLEDLYTMYASTLELLVNSHTELKNKKKMLDQAEKEVKQVKEKLEYFVTLKKYVEEKTNLENEYLWSMVTVTEKKIDELNRQKEELEDKKEQMAENESNYGSTVKTLEDELKQMQAKLVDFEEQVTKKHESVKEKERTIQSIQRQIDVLHSQCRQMMQKNDRHMTDINGIKEHIGKSDDSVHQCQTEKEQANEKMRQLREQLAEVQDRMKVAQREAENAQDNRIQKATHVDNLNSELKELDRNKRHIQHQIEDLRKCKEDNNNLVKFGNFMPALVEAVNNAHRRNVFVKKPVGPCGSHISLTGDNKWAKAVENVVGGLMSTFCCDNQKDFQALTRIMDEVLGSNTRQPPIIISRFRGRHDVSARKVSVRGLSAVVDVLRFDNDVAFNTLIDQTSLESILLFETDDEAASLLSYVQNVPRNLVMGVTQRGDQYHPAPNYRTYCGDGRASRFFTSTNRDSIITNFEIELKTMKENIAEKQTEYEHERRLLGEQQEFAKKADTTLRQLRQNKRDIEMELNKLKDVEESRPVMATRVALEEELKSLEAAHEENRSKIDMVSKQVDDLLKDKKKAEDVFRSLKEEENTLKDKVNEKRDELDEKKYLCKQQVQKRQGTSSKLTEINLHLEATKAEIKKNEEELKKNISDAKEVCLERIPTDREPLVIQKALDKCENYLKAAKKITGSKEDAINEYKAKKDSFDSMKKSMDLMDRLIDSLTQTTVSKEQRFRTMLSHTANLVLFFFQAGLQTRGYDGSLNFDYGNRTLEIEVKPKDDSQKARKDSKTLSGGERSYSTVSFILAIWRVVHMPFYFLDEFDVFMDKVNRKVIMDLLLQHAQQQHNMQFVFITPQDISSIPASDILSIYKMPDPERRLN